MAYDNDTITGNMECTISIEMKFSELGVYSVYVYTDQVDSSII